MILTMTRILIESFPNHSDISKDKLKKKLNEIIEKLDADASDTETFLSDIGSSSLLDDLELSFLYLYLQTCYAREERMNEDPVYESKSEDTFLDSLPCSVCFSDHYKALLIDTPVLIGSMRNPANKMQQNLLKSLIVTAIRKYEKDKGFSLKLSIASPYSICLYRRCLTDQSSTVVPDLDNIEASKIINALADELSLDDSYSSLVSNLNSIEYVDSKKNCGTSILVIEEAKRLDLEREFIENKRSFDPIRTGK